MYPLNVALWVTSSCRCITQWYHKSGTEGVTKFSPNEILIKIKK